MTPEEIPLGNVFDKYGNPVSFRGSVWWYTYDYKYNDVGGVIYSRYRDYDDTDLVYEYDDAGRLMYHNNTQGDWYRLTRDENGQILTKETQYGIVTYLAHDGFHGLIYSTTKNSYMAGCRDFAYEDAVDHWTNRKKETDLVIKYRASLFLDAIQNHHDYLNS